MNLEELTELSNDEINELCAVKVMGWKIERYPKWTLYIDNDGRQHEALQWNPTEDMNDCFVIVDKMLAKGWMLYDLKHAWRNEVASGFRCIFLHLDTGTSREWIDDSAAIALTKCACTAIQSLK